jgi:predicted small lipoprotein YifL
VRICWAQWLFIAVIGVLGAGQMLTACGNKGPLKLPDETSSTPAAEQEKPTKAAQKKSEKPSE